MSSDSESVKKSDINNFAYLPSSIVPNPVSGTRSEGLRPENSEHSIKGISKYRIMGVKADGM
ncbi:14810_t:CDS:2 [Acaulospora colombiana]|uniref:14810_t:CDS:1 n=1 Tax=Acaulospora colombiana TaxID=27376 RepID=A0ACA9MLW6_9GLOM|nr:14810_t:CDS:2 [Acaulospora colombiana]